MSLVKSNLKHFIAVAALASVTVLSAHAEISAPALKSLAGYQPTVITSESAALSLYQQLPTTPFKGDSGCYQRAHNWSFQLSKQNNINSMKVFLFFTERYKREFDYQWMYHVAPLIPVKQADGTVVDMVFDPTFINTPSWASASDAKNYDNKPIPVSEWVKYFIFPDVECPVVESYQDYFDYQDRYYCYIMKTPMFTYLPENLEAETEVRTTWRSGDLLQMKNAFK
jgi:hypothetical protein